MDRKEEGRQTKEDATANALNSLSKFTLFRTKTRLYVIASTDNIHRVLKIDRTDLNALNVVEDSTSYDEIELHQLLRMVKDGNKSQGGLDKVMDFYGLIGFIRFTASWYMVLMTKRSEVGLLGGHYIYHCDDTTLYPIGPKVEKSAQETKMINTFNLVDLSKNFYFSYSYDLTNTLQTNLTVSANNRRWNTRFMWNHHLLSPAFDLEEPRGRSRWIIPLIHGFVDQAKIHVFSRTVYLTLIARRSRHYAGARFLTRGANEHGHVANEVETEQIVSEPLSTSFGQHDSSRPEQLISDFSAGCGGYTSFVQYRGSIPVMWHQESNQMTPRPPIEITIKDPFYTPAAKHFDDLLGRYGSPIYILNLIKSRESVPRESKLLFEYGQCVKYLNQFLPEGKKMEYIAWDMSQAAKSGQQDVIGVLEDICEESLQATNFFHGGPARNVVGAGPRRDHPLLQHGILRVNCVDCLDRTNAAQFAIAKRAFGHQLYALGFLATPYLEFSCDAVDVLTEMYHDHGDTLAWQYTGSALVNRVDTYRRTKATQWSSHSRDILENIRRFYNNSMLDGDKQSAINLFLGVHPSVPTYDLTRPNYRQWYHPSHLEDPKADDLAPINQVYAEYYKPDKMSEFSNMYAFNMNSTSRFHAKSRYDKVSSPFEPREQSSHNSVPNARRIAPRWATVAETSGSPHQPSSSPDRPVRPKTIQFESPPSAIELFIRSLYDPQDLPERILSYEFYTHYTESEGIDMVCEEQDLEMYRMVARMQDGGNEEELLHGTEMNMKLRMNDLPGDSGELAVESRQRLSKDMSTKDKQIIERYINMLSVPLSTGGEYSF
ncbi:polyphosphoinositide phosphatase [Cryptococcus neoformans c45]|nr:polyphosphoinositide phosphatase [Cryptococcus neoformans var. grubii c45]